MPLCLRHMHTQDPHKELGDWTLMAVSEAVTLGPQGKCRGNVAGRFNAIRLLSRCNVSGMSVECSLHMPVRMVYDCVDLERLQWR